MTRSPLRRLVAPAVVAAALAAGCGHTGAAAKAPPAGPASTDTPATTVVTASPVTAVPERAAAIINAVQKDSDAAGAADAQAGNDIGAAVAAQAQDDNG